MVVLIEVFYVSFLREGRPKVTLFGMETQRHARVDDLKGCIKQAFEKSGMATFIAFI